MFVPYYKELLLVGNEWTVEASALINGFDLSDDYIGHALQMLSDFSITTPSGTVQGKAGDYILKDNDGYVSVLKSNCFNHRYKIIR